MVRLRPVPQPRHCSPAGKLSPPAVPATPTAPPAASWRGRSQQQVPGQSRLAGSDSRPVPRPRQSQAPLLLIARPGDEGVLSTDYATDPNSSGRLELGRLQPLRTRFRVGDSDGLVVPSAGPTRRVLPSSCPARGQRHQSLLTHTGGDSCSLALSRAGLYRATGPTKSHQITSSVWWFLN